MTRTSLKLISLLIVFSEVQAQLTYLFSEDGDAPICPTIVPSQANPSFILEPDSSNPQFRNGSYSEVPDNIIPGGRSSVENVPCSNDEFATCSRLSLLYNPPDSVDGGIRGSFTIIYTASNQATRRIDIEFGSKGIYLREPGQMFVRRPDQPDFLNDSLLVYGIVPPLALCYENGTEETEANFFVVDDSTCSSRVSSDGPNVQPGKFNILIPLEITGRHRMYVAERDCNSDRRSVLFDVIFDPPINPTTPTTQPPGSTQPTDTGLSLDAVIGIAVFCVVVVVMIVTAVVLFIILFIWLRRRRQKITHHNGVDGHSPDLCGGQNMRDPLVPVDTRQPPSQLPSKELYIVPSIDHEKVKLLQQRLCSCFSNLNPVALPNENGNFNQDLTRIVKGQHMVIILGDVGEITDNETCQSSSGRKWVNHFLSFNAFPKEHLGHVFYVRFGTTAIVPGFMDKLQQIPVLECPSDSSFDPARIAEHIHNKIEERIQQNDTSDLGSELSESSWKGGSHETKTEDEETHDTDGQLTGSNNAQGFQGTLAIPAVARLRAASHGSSTSGSLESASTTSVRTTGRDEGEAIERGEEELRAVKNLDKPIKNSEPKGDLQSSSTVSVMEVLGNLIEAVEVVGKDVKKVEGAVEAARDDVKVVGGAVGTLGKNLDKDGAKMKDRMKRMEQDIEYALDEAELARNELDSHLFGTVQRYSDEEEDSEGKETGDLGGATTRDDTV